MLVDCLFTLILRYFMPPAPQGTDAQISSISGNNTTPRIKTNSALLPTVCISTLQTFFSMPASRPGNGFRLLFVLPETGSAACSTKPVALLASKAAARSSAAMILSSRQRLIQNVLSPSQCLIQHALSPLQC